MFKNLQSTSENFVLSLLGFLGVYDVRPMGSTPGLELVVMEEEEDAEEEEKVEEEKKVEEEEVEEEMEEAAHSLSRQPA